jgi:O-acetyl-ADP-ribose deacetylase (regulator of RNase III)
MRRDFQFIGGETMFVRTDDNRELPILTQKSVIRRMIDNRERYSLWVGAGVSAEAGVPTANEISNEIATEIIDDEFSQKFRGFSYNDADPDAATRKLHLDYLNKFTGISCSDTSKRFFALVGAKYDSLIGCSNFFREKCRGTIPAFAHVAAALLVEHRVFRRSILSTNFDKLVERAFAENADIECQAIRYAEEVQFYRNTASDRAFIFKLHGDYDTGNTKANLVETRRIDDKLKGACVEALREAGLIALGASGYESSINELFLNFAAEREKNPVFLEHGVFWGVYIGQEWPITDDVDRCRVAVNEGAVNRELLKALIDLRNLGAPVGLFPITGAGNFLQATIERACTEELRNRAYSQLDHKQRVAAILRSESLSESRIQRHLATLAMQTKKLDDIRKSGGRDTEDKFIRGLTLTYSQHKRSLSFSFGNIVHPKFTSFALSRAHEAENRLSVGAPSAIISPDDTCLTIGGGAALTIAHKAGGKAGSHQIAREVAKQHPLELGGVAVTSAGVLPFTYIFHVAGIKIVEDNTPGSVNGTARSSYSIRKCFENVLGISAALGVQVLLCPLIAGGTGGISKTDSLNAIIGAFFADMRKEEANPPEQRRPLHLALIEFDESAFADGSIKGLITATAKVYGFQADEDTPRLLPPSST